MPDSTDTRACGKTLTMTPGHPDIVCGLPAGHDNLCRPHPPGPADEPRSWAVPANTHEAFSSVIGLKVTGVIFNALPTNRQDLARGTKTLIFEDGSGLTVGSNGSFWREAPAEVARAVKRKREELTRAQDELAGILELAGEVVGG